MRFCVELYYMRNIERPPPTKAQVSGRRRAIGQNCPAYYTLRVYVLGAHPIAKSVAKVQEQFLSNLGMSKTKRA